ncbi:small glutamine-rich tetratricopeptide repeat-containing protein 2 [Artemisia annua]|uniref:Small glutamine-rich tetratricopeptide repeat-containing protein 2 n=1 Tax=Artemisia annua TaxID=35608 RepID=A0A2U1MER6_ARTAN|nr:small glutamine-rich tetratricopeptide repeat-containing protein 2 [Artemisia annua]
MANETDPPTIKATKANTKGDTHFSAGNYQASVKNYTHAINLVPSDYVYYLNRSKAQAALEEFKEALLDANSALSLKLVSPDSFLWRGLAYYGLRQFKEAVKRMRKASKLFLRMRS